MPDSARPASTERTLVSVVIPCRNEESYIGPCLDSLVAQDWPKEWIEVFVVDGLSDDDTRAIVAVYAAAHSWIHLVDNPRGITPVALNIGIRRSTGGIVCRVDAHCSYPSDYISSLVSQLERSGADNTGGVCRTLPANDRPMARAIAAALAHPFAVGNSHFRIGTSRPRWVDTVPFGCYRRSVFDKIGLFDEELVRNQDDEFNHRLLKHGGRILLVPSIVVDYYARATVPNLARMMYQYGYFKPLAGKKLGRVATLRQLVPPAFVAGLTSSVSLSPWWHAMRDVSLIIAASYLTLLLITGVHARSTHGVAVALRLMVSISTVHFAYGIGFLRGTWDHIIRGGTPTGNAPALPVSR